MQLGDEQLRLHGALGGRHSDKYLHKSLAPSPSTSCVGKHAATALDAKNNFGEENRPGQQTIDERDRAI